jgi:hypothetical protein
MNEEDSAHAHGVPLVEGGSLPAALLRRQFESVLWDTANAAGRAGGRTHTDST